MIPWNQKKKIDSLIGRINGELGEHDWMPVRYLFRSYTRDFPARVHEVAQVGLLTPLRDGMNLVAKEYMAAQHPVDPGVLVLSRCAGAAEELEDLAGPEDPPSRLGTIEVRSSGIPTALS